MDKTTNLLSCLIVITMVLDILPVVSGKWIPPCQKVVNPNNLVDEFSDCPCSTDVKARLKSDNELNNLEYQFKEYKVPGSYHYPYNRHNNTHKKKSARSIEPLDSQTEDLLYSLHINQEILADIESLSLLRSKRVSF